ncbi:MAG: 1-acyl-sn-glycerol-3-phosphate acyltransferase [Opitutae bacterium]|nr:1-acyl-sn-glycerol-3-phosphate acyltransferase [Opitutae bacterium]
MSGTLAYFAAIYACDPRNRRSLAARAHWLQRTCRSLLRVLGIHRHATGRPAPGTMVVSNHVSYVDIMVLSAAAPVVFVAKSEVRGWPIFGWFAQLAGTRFIDRKRRSDVARVADEIAPALAEGLGVVLFLEGTSSDGSSVLPFKASLLEPAARGRWPVQPTAVGYLVPPGHSAAQEVCWWGDMTLAPHLANLLTLQRIDAHVAWGEPVPGNEDRKLLAAELQARVSALHATLPSVAVQTENAG